MCMTEARKVEDIIAKNYEEAAKLRDIINELCKKYPLEDIV